MKNIDILAREIVEGNLGKEISEINRFSTGLSHFVFDVATADHQTFVLRIARPERMQEFQQGIKWHQIIANVGVRLPEIYEIGEINGHHYAVYERLKGDDLENVYSALSIKEKHRIAEEVAEIQRKILTIGRENFQKVLSWKEILERIVDRSEREIHLHGLCDPKYVRFVCAEIDKKAGYFQIFQPKTFLYDLSVRNVIILNGKVEGIIDVDDVWFGDPLLAIGRGKTILVAMNQDTVFIDHWCNYLKLSSQQMEMVEFYSLLYCLRFMGTIGTKLNGNASIQTNPENAQLFERIADKILRESGSAH